jgi:hypothetical protein
MVTMQPLADELAVRCGLQVPQPLPANTLPTGGGQKVERATEATRHPRGIFHAEHFGATFQREKMPLTA